MSEQRLASGVRCQQCWKRLAQSRLFLAFIILFMISVIYTVALGAYAVIRESFSTFLGGDVELFILILLATVVGFVLIGAAFLIVCFWLIRAKAESTSKGKTVGLSMLFWGYVALLVITIISFVITLPAFSEWLPYQEAYDKPLQVVYCVYIFVGINSALAMMVVKKMRDNLSISGGSTGPVVALAVVYMLRGLFAIAFGIVLASLNIMFALSGIILFVAFVLLVILLFRYQGIFSKIY